MAEAEVKKVLALVPELLEVPYPRIWTSYDKEADVLYTSDTLGALYEIGGKGL